MQNLFSLPCFLLKGVKIRHNVDYRLKFLFIFAARKFNIPFRPQIMIRFTPIENLSVANIIRLAKHEHDRIMRSTKVTVYDLDYESSYSVFVYNGSRNIAFIRKALIELRDKH